MLEFVQSPTYFNWIIKNKPSSSMIVCSPFIKETTLTQLLNDCQFAKNHASLKFTFIIRANAQDFKQGSSDISAVNLLHELSIKYPDSISVRIVSNIHMKAYLVDEKKLLITSGNLTPRGITIYGVNGNAEGGIACDDETIVNDFILYFNDLFASGQDISLLVASPSYKKFVKKKKKSAKKPTTIAILKSNYKIPPPKDFKKYAISEGEETKFVSFKAIHKRVFTTNNATIPQLAKIENYEKVLKFISSSDNSDKTQDDLAIHLGSTAKTKDCRRRMIYGILQNLKLYGLIDDSENDLPQITSTGTQYLNASDDMRKSILKNQTANLSWVNDISLLRQDNPDMQIRNLVLEYLCNRPLCYCKTTAQRYVTGMVYICSLHNIK